MASLDGLTDGEIRSRLAQYGYSAGPVTATTRKVLLKKLKHLMASASENHDASDPLGYDPRCSVTNFSSGDESDEGAVKGGGGARRKSMPPPKSVKTPPRRRSPARSINSAQPLANSTLVDHATRPQETPAAASYFDTAPRSRPTAPASRHSIGVPDFSSLRTSSTPDPDDRPSPLIRDSSSYSASTSFLKSNYGLNDGFRSRFQSSNSFASPASPSYQSNQPYSSEFARRLSTLQSSRIGGSSALSSNKLLDVKESDDEDNGSIPVYTRFGQSGVKGSSVLQTRSSGRVSQDSWFSCDSPVSALLVIFFFLFFLAIGTTYINMHSVDSGLTTSSGINVPLCSMQNRQMSGDHCVKDSVSGDVTKLFWIVHKELIDRSNNAGCIGFEGLEPLTDLNIVHLAAEQDKTMSADFVSGNIDSLKALVHANPRLNIAATPDGLRLADRPTSLKCYFLQKLANAAQWLFKLSFIAATIYTGYRGTKWWMWKNAKYKEEVYRLVSNIVDIVSSRTQEGNGFIPISHVRDQLIPPMERNKMAKLWNDAVTLLESDSRLRSEIQLVEGEEFQVWRWLASPLSACKRKVWQGQAFETVEGSVNSLPDSPTAYLKIRHMFDPALEEGDDWVTTVRDAILEKCGDAKILHIFVDKHSREGCVYMKCASPREAGVAYRALHGSWFDSKLVTVKYIREKRYLERFPDSANNTVSLQPSNDNRNSLQ